MAYTTINKSTDNFNTLTYSGNGSARTVTGVGFQPDFFWIKQRSNNQSHMLWDTIRGGNYYMGSNHQNASNNDVGTFTAASDGYSFGTDNAYNGSGQTYVGWNWKAASSGSSNSDGTITSTVAANAAAGFSIVKYTGTGSGSATVGHGLGVKPKILLVKAITGSENWHWWQDTDNDGTANQRLVLNFQNANYNNYFTSFQNTTFTLPSLNDNGWSANGTEFMAYVFAEKLGYSKFDYYVGNGNTSGPFVYTGFKPAMIIAKNISATQDWVIKDNKRPGFNQIDDVLYPNGNYAEGHGADVDFLSNGFKMRSTANNINANGQVFIYMAFAEEPLVANVGANGIPATAR